MGSGTWTTCSYNTTLSNHGFASTNSILTSSISQVFTQSTLAPELDPKNVVRECCENKEHPNTIPIILGLDVTGSMNRASKACIAKLNETILSLYEQFKDVEIAVAGIGDFSYDDTPFQLSQFESDVRIADNLFKIYVENGGGGNSWESYSALWHAGLHHAKLDCWNRGKKGILISMGDEMLNPTLSKNKINSVFGDSVQDDVDTEELYNEVIEKYDVYHIAITNDSSFDRYETRIDNSFGKLLGQNLIKASSDKLSEVITQIVEDSVNKTSVMVTDTNGCIFW